jgi:hypothetical protein
MYEIDLRNKEVAELRGEKKNCVSVFSAPVLYWEMLSSYLGLEHEYAGLNVSSFPQSLQVNVGIVHRIPGQNRLFPHPLKFFTP